MSDLIDREALLHKAWLAFYAHEDEMEKKDPDYLLMKRLYEQNGFEIFHSTAVNAPTVEERPIGEWIPVKYRPLTAEERIEFAKHYGIEYCDTVSEKAFDCPMPEDGQEILVSAPWGVSIDVADNDIDEEGFIVYGLYGIENWEVIDAWMPLPEPYKEEES